MVYLYNIYLYHQIDEDCRANQVLGTIMIANLLRDETLKVEEYTSIIYINKNERLHL